MFRIGDFSRLGQVSTRMLRHYDKLGLLSPSHVDQWTGYRYYTIDQLARLHRIIALKDLGFKLELIGNMLDQVNPVSPEQLRGMLTMRQAELAQELTEKEHQLHMVEARLKQIEQEGEPSPYEVVVKSLPSQPAAGIRQIVPHLSEMNYYCKAMYTELYKRLKIAKLPPLDPEIVLYHTTEYREENVEVEVTVAISEKDLERPIGKDLFERRILPEEKLAACVIFEGVLSEMEPAVLALLTYIGTNNHMANGPLREVHLSGPAHPLDQPDPKTSIVELQVPIAKLAA